MLCQTRGAPRGARPRLSDGRHVPRSTQGCLSSPQGHPGVLIPSLGAPRGAVPDSGAPRGARPKLSDTRPVPRRTQGCFARLGGHPGVPGPSPGHTHPLQGHQEHPSGFTSRGPRVTHGRPNPPRGVLPAPMGAPPPTPPPGPLQGRAADLPLWNFTTCRRRRDGWRPIRWGRGGGRGLRVGEGQGEGPTRWGRGESGSGR